MPCGISVKQLIYTKLKYFQCFFFYFSLLLSFILSANQYLSNRFYWSTYISKSNNFVFVCLQVCQEKVRFYLAWYLLLATLICLLALSQCTTQLWNVCTCYVHGEPSISCTWSSRQHMTQIMIHSVLSSFSSQ